MTNFGIAALLSMLLSVQTWQPDFESAKKMAAEKHQLLLLNFSGSDWCGPCIRMHKEIFGSDDFSKMADTTLVLYNADFPRNKKNQLPVALKKQNEKLADKYNPEGNFPLTVLLNEKGEVVKSWIGMPEGTSVQFASTIKSLSEQLHSK
ncbi:MAG: thioredoxin family protein [Chitinophagaceae bacterium]|nr:MAG: thioredoxin family protein [Chitinophagaceae bacterium]